MNSNMINEIVENVMKLIKESKLVEVEASGRHVHLCRSDVEALFGEGYQLEKVKELSQPGQYACKERVSIKGPKGTLENVVVLGPERKDSQVELSLTDATAIGIKIPIKQSGDISGTPGIIIASPKAQIEILKGAIVAKRHIHLTPQDAKNFGLKDGDMVSAQIFGKRPLIFEDVIARVSSQFKTCMHIDYDEANACGYEKGNYANIMSVKPLGKPSPWASFADVKGEDEDTACIHKKLIIESDLNKLFLKGNKRITIPRNSIITPLGEDFLRSHQMSVFREKAGEDVC